jgi:hypothetical protein
MIGFGTWETGDEILIHYVREQRDLYDGKDPRCIYKQFERQVGINKGNFVEMVATKFLQNNGYRVESFYYLVRNRKKREEMPGFLRIIQIFGEAKVRQFISESDSAFRLAGKKIASGDPDLFVYKESTKECFFVEVKEADQITDNQRILFPLIQRHLCPVFIARVVAEP